MSGTPHDVVSIGEGMLEISRGAVGLEAWRLRFAGDTLNAATYIARLGLKVSYLTALGEDPFSQKMQSEWAAESIDTEMVLTKPDKMPGLYLIDTDDHGERSFYYWRGDSAVRSLFSCPGIDNALRQASMARCIYLSGITLSLFADEQRQRLVKLCAEVKGRGGIVAFDPNYRPAGWPSRQAAQNAIAQIAPHVSIALPTLADDVLLYGETTVEDCLQRWRSNGVKEIAIKLGAKGATVSMDGALVSVPTQEEATPRDTTGAGDAFNAAYLAARLNGHSEQEAARSGNLLAAAVVRQPGAIISRATMPLGTIGSARSQLLA